MSKIIFDFTGQRIDFAYTVNFITEELNSYCSVRCINRVYLNNIASDSEFISDKINIISFLLNFNQL